MPAHVGAASLKKPHHIATLRFNEVLKDRANYAVGKKTIYTAEIIPFLHCFPILVPSVD